MQGKCFNKSGLEPFFPQTPILPYNLLFKECMYLDGFKTLAEYRFNKLTFV